MTDAAMKITVNLNSGDAEVREAALDAIGASMLENAFEIIQPFLYDPSAEVRGTAAHNLGEIHDPRAIPQLIAFCSVEKDRMALAYGFYALDEYTDSRILSFFVGTALSLQSSRTPHQQIAKQLRKYEGETSVQTLIWMFEHDEDEIVRCNSIESLLILNRPDLADFWRLRLRDKNPIVCRAARRALEQLNA